MRWSSDRVAAGEDLYHLDEQALADLDADVILTQDLCAVCAVDLDRVDDALAYLGCSARVVTLDPSSLDDVIDSIRVVGDVLGVAEDAARLVDSLRRRLESLASCARATRRARDVVVLEWTDPPFSAGHWVPDLVVAGGGAPSLANRGHDSVRIEWDAVRDARAEVVVVAPCGYHLRALRRAGPAAGRPRPAPGRRRGLGGRRRQPLRAARPAPGGGRRDHGPDPAPGPRGSPGTGPGPPAWTPDGQGASSAQASMTGSTSRQSVRSAIAVRVRRHLVGGHAAAGVERVEAGEAGEHPQHVGRLLDGDVGAELALLVEPAGQVLHAAPSAFLEADHRAAHRLRVERRHREEGDARRHGARRRSATPARIPPRRCSRASGWATASVRSARPARLHSSVARASNRPAREPKTRYTVVRATAARVAISSMLTGSVGASRSRCSSASRMRRRVASDDSARSRCSYFRGATPVT